MSDPHHLLVGDLIDLLGRYDPMRVIVSGDSPLETVVSVEPGGAVLLVADGNFVCNPVNAKIERRQRTNMFGMPMPGPSDEDE